MVPSVPDKYRKLQNEARKYPVLYSPRRIAQPNAFFIFLRAVCSAQCDIYFTNAAQSTKTTEVSQLISFEAPVVKLSAWYNHQPGVYVKFACALVKVKLKIT